MKLRKNSWYDRIVTVYGCRDPWFIENGSVDFCEYWRSFILGCLVIAAISFVGALTSVVLVLFPILAILVYINTGVFLLGNFVGIGIVSCTLIGLFLSSPYVTKGVPNIIKIKYHSYKEKYCPLVEYGE